MVSDLSREWPPPKYDLPNLDALDELSRGGPLVQRELLPLDPVDDSREARLQRILAAVPGVKRAAEIARWAR